LDSINGEYPGSEHHRGLEPAHGSTGPWGSHHIPSLSHHIPSSFTTVTAVPFANLIPESSKNMGHPWNISIKVYKGDVPAIKSSVCPKMVDTPKIASGVVLNHR